MQDEYRALKNEMKFIAIKTHDIFNRLTNTIRYKRTTKNVPFQKQVKHMSNYLCSVKIKIKLYKGGKLCNAWFDFCMSLNMSQEILSRLTLKHSNPQTKSASL